MFKMWLWENREGLFSRGYYSMSVFRYGGSVEKELASLVCEETAEPVLACS